MAYLTQEQLKSIGFKKLGNNVKISDKSSIYNPKTVEVWDNSRIDDFCVISGKVIIRNNVHVAVFCNLSGGSEGIFMDSFSGLAYGCHVFTQSDDYSGKTLTNPTIPAKFKNEIKKAITIERHSIVGARSLIFPGVTLAEGTSIGALSLVNKSTKSWSIYFGIPAKRIKARSRDLLDLEQQYLREQSQD